MKPTVLVAGLTAVTLLIAFLLLGPTAEPGPEMAAAKLSESTGNAAGIEAIGQAPQSEGNSTGDADASNSATQENQVTSFSELPATPARQERLEAMSGGMTLSPRVIAIVTEIQTRQSEEQWEEATNELNALYTEWDLLNTLEKTTLLNFYTNNFLAQEMYPEAIATFNRMLAIPDLRPDVAARALKALGQLYLATDQPELAVPQFEEWIESSGELDLREGEKERVEEFLQQSQSQVEKKGEFDL